MKRTTHLKSWLSIIMMLFMVGNAWGQANIHTSNVTLDKGTNAQEQTIKLEAEEEGYASMKLGTGSNTGIATFKIEAGTTKIHLHVAGWNGDGTHDLIVKTNVGNFAGITDPDKNRTITIPLTNDEGISGSTTTMTLAHPELASTTYYKEIVLENVTEMATITLQTSAKRAVVWGINAEITKITYKITYDGNGFTGGEVPVDNTQYEKGDEGTVLEPGTMSKYGYEFLWWNTEPDDSGDYYLAGDNEITVNSNITLYAQWQAKDCNVTWYVNGISYTTGYPTKKVTFGGKVSNLPTAPVDPFDNDLTFVGWTDQPINETSTKAPSILFSSAAKAPKVNVEDVKYYAVFASEEGSSATLQKIEKLTDIVDGTYAILSSDEWEDEDEGVTKTIYYYLPNAEKTTAGPAVSVAKDEDENSIIIKEDMKWELTIKDGVINFESASQEGNYLFGGGSSAPTIRVGNAISSFYGKDKPSTKDWIAENDPTYGIIIKANGTARYLATYIKPDFSAEDWRNYAKTVLSSNLAAHLYKIVGGVSYSNYTTHHIQVNVGSTGYSTLYYSDQYLVMPDDVTAKTYKLEGQNFVESKVYEAKSANLIIPKDEAVVIFSQEAFDKKATTPIFFSKTTIMSFKDNNNELKGTDEATDLSTLYTLNEIASNYFYALTRDKEKKNVGFYWMNETGTTFTNGAHKAYLLLPKSRAAGVKGFSLDGDFETAIVETLDVNNEVSESDAIYNLSGQRVNKVSKGIFIKNGKKYIAK